MTYWSELTTSEDISTIMATLYKDGYEWDFSTLLDNPGITMTHFNKLRSDLCYFDFIKLGDVTRMNTFSLEDLENIIKEDVVNVPLWVIENDNIYKMIDFYFFKKYEGVKWNMLLMSMHCKVCDKFLEEYAIPQGLTWNDELKENVKYLDSLGLSLNKSINKEA